MCVFIFAKAGQNIIRLPVRCLFPVGWLEEFTPEGTVLWIWYPLCNCAGLLKCKGQKKKEKKKKTQMLQPMSWKTAELILQQQMHTGIIHQSHSFSGAPQPPHALCWVNSSGLPVATGARRSFLYPPFCLSSKLMLLPGGRVASRQAAQLIFHW